MPRNSDTALTSAPGASAGRERLWFALAALALVGLGGSFWLANGTRTFGELMLGAFSWCF